MLEKYESIIYSIERGKMHLQIEPIMCKHIQQLLEIANDSEVILHFEDLAEGWKTVYIYKNPLMGVFIKLINETPKTALEHMTIGLLLGYDLESIHDFLIQEGLLK